MSASVEEDLVEAALVEPEDNETEDASLPAIDAATVDACRLRTALEIRDVDDVVAVTAQRCFFHNDVAQAEAMLRGARFKDPLAANGYGVIGTVRALLSTEQADVNEGCERLMFAAAFGRAILPPEGSVVTKTVSAVAGAASWLYRSVTKKDAPAVPDMTPAEFRAHVIVAEAETLRATLLLLQETLAGYLKAGFALRRSYNIYDRLQKYIEAKKKQRGGSTTDEDVVPDRNSLYGMYFGLGCIHVVTSILPPKVVVLLKALGYMHDRQTGFQYLMKALASDTLRSPLASLSMLAYHALLPSFASLLAKESVPFARRVLDETLRMYPVSLIHLWLAGRTMRLERAVPESITTFQRCIELSKSSSLHELLPQLHHFALYDLGWSHCLQLRWAEAAAAFKELEMHSGWSKKAYAYAYGTCTEMIALGECVEGGKQLTAEEKLALRTEASDAFKRALRHAPIKLGGRVISIDQFVTRRLREVKRMALLTAGVTAAAGGPAASPTGIEGATSPLYPNDPAYYDSDDAELPAPVVLSNEFINPLCGLHLLVLFNMTPQMETGALRVVAASASAAMSRSVAATALHDVAATPSSFVSPLAVPPHVATPLDQAAVLCLLRAFSLSSLGEAAEAEKLFRALQQPSIGAALRHEKWITAYAFYGHAVMLFDKPGDGPTQCQAKLQEMRQRLGSADYNFEMQMQFRAHLTQHVLEKPQQGHIKVQE
jgi:hypothetical protein